MVEAVVLVFWSSWLGMASKPIGVISYGGGLSNRAAGRQLVGYGGAISAGWHMCVACVRVLVCLVSLYRPLFARWGCCLCVLTGCVSESASGLGRGTQRGGRRRRHIHTPSFQTRLTPQSESAGETEKNREMQLESKPSSVEITTTDED